jgi:hypothetical protein
MTMHLSYLPHSSVCSPPVRAQTCLAGSHDRDRQLALAHTADPFQTSGYHDPQLGPQQSATPHHQA